jgi:hypothetical protein
MKHPRANVKARIRYKFVPLVISTRIVAQGKSQTVRKNVTFSAVTVEYLEELASKGTHGSDVVAVIRTMVEEGVRRAIRDGFITAR